MTMGAVLMADRPILFSAPMIRAILEGRKTQTRRVLTKARVFATPETPAFTLAGDALSRALQGASGFRHLHGDGWFWEADAFEWQVPAARTGWMAHIGYALGDRLWVKETWSHSGDGVFEISQARMLGRGGVIYRADNDPRHPNAKYWPSIFMPREFSRLTLTVTDVRVQRLQEISGEDAVAEGVRSRLPDNGIAQQDFADLWSIINTAPGKRWYDNPWIVAISFDVARRNIDGGEG